MNAVRRMYAGTRGFLTRLHEDESGPSTVEWILLVVVALVVLVGIYAIVKWSSSSTEAQAEAQDAAKKKAGDAMKDLENLPSDGAGGGG